MIDLVAVPSSVAALECPPHWTVAWRSAVIHKSLVNQCAVSCNGKTLRALKLQYSALKVMCKLLHSAWWPCNSSMQVTWLTDGGVGGIGRFWGSGPPSPEILDYLCKEKSCCCWDLDAGWIPPPPKKNPGHTSVSFPPSVKKYFQHPCLLYVYPNGSTLEKLKLYKLSKLWLDLLGCKVHIMIIGPWSIYVQYANTYLEGTEMD